ncbi:hypothetical protein SEA_JUMBO_71 [Gordonia phage Jumbo]|uniref:Uncharacterized protein n=1 Tax=Gordonia phage Jumbo TaxID=1887650 RepID=A0A1B3B0R0_9CAUD|nr:hypothetical protein BIZ69_gp071 [Gordonia phage Jumbo]AOE44579.1 hypothetical protein SEA_JUMBO_71 [Gordonia phage Jumbo]
MTDLFGGLIPSEPSRQKGSPEKKVPSKPRKNSAAPEPVANRFNLPTRPAPAGPDSSKKAEISAGTEPQPAPAPQPRSSKKAEISAGAVIPANEPLDNDIGELQRTIDIFRVFGMLGE